MCLKGMSGATVSQLATERRDSTAKRGRTLWGGLLHLVPFGFVERLPNASAKRHAVSVEAVAIAVAVVAATQAADEHS